MLLPAYSFEQSSTHFSHSLVTAAPPEKIWSLWTDVANWNKWDDGLKTASLTGPFQAGAKGRLIPDKGPASRFRITDLIPQTSYTFKTKLPLGALYVKRTLSPEGNGTRFTHEIWFTGLSKGIFGKVLGKKYRRILPSVMEKIRELAEQ